MICTGLGKHRGCPYSDQGKLPWAMASHREPVKAKGMMRRDTVPFKVEVPL